MPLQGYAEVAFAAAPARRFLLDIDVSVIGTDAEPAPTAVSNVVDINGNGTPDLRIALIIRRVTATETRVEIRMTPMPGQILKRANVWVYIDTNQTVVPAGTDAGPDSFVYVGYVGVPDEVMPPIRVTVGRSTVTFPGASGPTDIVDVDARLSTAVPRRLEIGQLKGPVVRANGVTTTFTGPGTYAEGAPTVCRTAGPRPPLGSSPTVPDAMAVSLTITDPATSDGSSLAVRILTTHTQGADSTLAAPANRVDRPGRPTPPTVALAGAGAGKLSRGAYTYRVTYLLNNGNETAASDPSAPVVVADPATNGQVRLTNVPVGAAPPGAELSLGVKSRRIYRTLASADGGAGEYFRVGEVPGNTSKIFVDNTPDRGAAPDSLPGPRVPDSIGVIVKSSGIFDLKGVLHTRTAGVTDTYQATLQAVPRNVTITSLSEPGAGKPRVHWVGDSVLRFASVACPTLRGGVNKFFEAHIRELPGDVGVDWSLEGSTRTRIELCGAAISSTLPTGIGDLAVMLAPAPRSWRDAPQTVCLELVERRSSTGVVQKARTRIGARGVRRFRLALGENGRHSRWDEGLIVDLALGPDRLAPGAAPPDHPPERALRMLSVDDRFVGSRHDTSQLAVRAGVLPDQLHLDLRSTPPPPNAPDGGYLGVALDGEVRRLKVLSLTDPAAGSEAFAADGLRLWVTAASTGPKLDARRDGTDITIASAGDLPVELSARDPRGLDGGPQPLKLVKAALRVPPTVVISTAAATFLPGSGATPLNLGAGMAAAGSTAGHLVDGASTFLDGWVGGSVRYRSGGLAGQRRTITAVDVNHRGVQTQAFPAAPAVGDRYVVEQGAGLTVETAAGAGAAGVSGRLALTKDLAGGTVRTRPVDRLLATRATPQVRILNGPGLRAATGRFLGVTDLHVSPVDGGPLGLHLALDAARVNPAFRALVRENDTRFAPAERDMLKARLSTVPADVLFSADTSRAVFEVRLAKTAGEGSIWAEPGLVRDALAGTRAGTVAGVGILEAAFDGLPRAARVTLIGATAPGVPSPVPGDLTPHNWTPPAGWRTTGTKIEISDTIDVHFVRSISWGADRPLGSNDVPVGTTGVATELDGLISVWGRIDAAFLTITHEMPAKPTDPPTLASLVMWNMDERPPADPFDAGGGLGFLIGTDLLVTVDANVFGKRALEPVHRWDDIGQVLGDWYLSQELQMKDYRGEVTIAKPLGLGGAGDGNAGPGLWFLRTLNTLPWFGGFGSVYFGNTGGTFFTRPRIFS